MIVAKKKKLKKEINNTTIHYMENRTDMVNFQIVYSGNVALLSVRRRNLGGLSNYGEDLSIQHQQ